MIRVTRELILVFDRIVESREEDETAEHVLALRYPSKDPAPGSTAVKAAQDARAYAFKYPSWPATPALPQVQSPGVVLVPRTSITHLFVPSSCARSCTID